MVYVMHQAPQLFGKVFKDRYRVGNLIGGGGFGWVYRGVDEVIDRPVALKILQPQYGAYTKEQRERFLQEAKMTARNKAASTVSLYDYGESLEGETLLLFMVMEYIEGETLDRRIKKQGRLAPLEVLHVMRQILYSLSQAHEQGYIHRDLKPANIMVFDDPTTQQLGVKVLDYGIAKAFTTQHGWSHYTQTDAGMNLTPHYASPEQIDFTGETKVGPHTDLYMLGLVSFCCLTGSHPLDHLDPQDVKLILTWHISPVLARLPKPFDKGPLSDIIHKLLIKNLDPEISPVRYMTCKEVLDDLMALETQAQREQRAMPTGPHQVSQADEVSEPEPESLSVPPEEPETLILQKQVKEDEAYLLTQPAPDPEVLYSFEDARTHVFNTPVPAPSLEKLPSPYEEATELILPQSSWRPLPLLGAALLCMGLGSVGVWALVPKPSAPQNQEAALAQEPSLETSSTQAASAPPAALVDMGAPKPSAALVPDQSVDLAHTQAQASPESKTSLASSKPVTLKKAPKAVSAKSTRRPPAKEEAPAPKPEPQEAPKETAKAQPPVEPKDEVSNPTPTTPKNVPSLKLEPQPVERKVWAVE